ncbi:unnamed protein product [Heligmosomoides polygyrus]|uniref:Nuclear receptor domain-containing protein n=1 Tax=Heligmosomoides polygyrus TaxID=6339 RepID=A0A183FYC7_HELPZ|nr:unnamed protein product [Heligmosomoides polygyrus]
MHLSRFSFRKNEWRAPGMPPDLVCAFFGEVGMHYGESCQRITDEDMRDDIIGQDRACFRYRDFCPGGQRCKCRRKRCFDCQIMEGTVIEDLIPIDEGQHGALGNVLHKELRIQELEDDGRRLTGLWQFFSERRDSQGRRTTSTRAGVTTSRLL